jgi:proteasome lid subunit RPN8/RPN11
MELPDNIRAAMREDAAKRQPEEACGFVLRVNGELVLRPAKNTSNRPVATRQHAATFRIAPEDFEAAEDEGEIVELYHSHVNESPNPSPTDIAISEKHQIVSRIISYPGFEEFVYVPKGYAPPLLGRTFVHGIWDCYALLRDFYREKLSIELPDFEREDEWWLPKKNEKGEIIAPAQNLYLDHLEEAGFRRVEDLRLYDAILMQINSDVPNHVAVYVAEGMIMHHLFDRKSCEQPYHANFGYYAKHSYAICRHETNPSR